jgi:hypothetical protein
LKRKSRLSTCARKVKVNQSPMVSGFGHYEPAQDPRVRD